MTDPKTDPIAYWREGAAIVEACLTKALKADPSDAPFPLAGREAAIWHEAQASAYQHALEMMGPPTEGRTTTGSRVASRGGSAEPELVSYVSDRPGIGVEVEVRDDESLLHRALADRQASGATATPISSDVQPTPKSRWLAAAKSSPRLGSRGILRLVARDSGMVHGHVDYRSCYLSANDDWYQNDGEFLISSGEAATWWTSLDIVNDGPAWHTPADRPPVGQPVLIRRSSGYRTYPVQAMSAIWTGRYWKTLQGDNLGDSGDQPIGWISYDQFEQAPPLR